MHQICSVLLSSASRVPDLTWLQKSGIFVLTTVKLSRDVNQDTCFKCSVCVYLDTGRTSQVHVQWQPWSIYQGPGLLAFLDLQSYIKSILRNLGRWQRWHWGGENGFSWEHIYDKVVECITQKEVWSNARSGETETCRDTRLGSRC